MKKLLLQASLALLLCLFAFSCGKDDEPNESVDTSPSITGFTPNSGPVGTAVTINGKNFGTTPANNTVKFGTVTATVGSASASSLQVTVPKGAQTAKISVTVNGETATSSSTFTVTEDLGPTTLSLDKESLELRTTETDVLTPTADGNGANETVAWSSDNEDVAIVDQEGNVTATGAGTATITATVDNVTASCTIIVNPSIIMAGTTYDGNYYHAVLWINGVLQELSASANFLPPSVDISNGNIYVTYSDYNDDDVVMTVLKNGNLMNEWEFGPWTEEGQFTRASTAIDAVGSDVYVSGFENNDAVYWKNGGKVTLLEPLYWAQSKDLVVKDGTVYTAVGYDGGGFFGQYYIDSEAAGIIQDNNPPIEVSAIEVDDSNNIYIAGSFDEIARAWKNGDLLHDLNQGGDTNSVANGLAISGNDLITVGTNYANNTSYGRIWLNDQLAQEFQGESGPAQANDVVIYGDKAYIAAYKYPNAVVLVMDTSSGNILDEIVLPNSNGSLFDIGHSIMVK